MDADRTDRAIDALTGQFGAEVIDVTQVLIEAMRTQAAEVGLPWDMVQAADAAPPGSRDAAGLTVLVQRSLPAVEAAIDAAVSDAPEGTRPVLLTEIAPLARYGHLAMLSRWADLAARAAAGDLGARPATVRQPGRHHRQAAPAARGSRPVLPPGRRLDRCPRPPFSAAEGTS